MRKDDGLPKVSEQLRKLVHDAVVAITTSAHKPQQQQPHMSMRLSDIPGQTLTLLGTPRPSRYHSDYCGIMMEGHQAPCNPALRKIDAGHPDDSEPLR